MVFIEPARTDEDRWLLVEDEDLGIGSGYVPGLRIDVIVPGSVARDAARPPKPELHHPTQQPPNLLCSQTDLRRSSGL